MKLDEIKEMMNENWVVHFEEKFNDNSTFYCTINVKELYDDWYGDCNLCSENDALVWNVQLSDDSGNVYLIDTGYKFEFQTLMYAIEEAVERKNTSQVNKLRANKNPEIRNIVECAFSLIKDCVSDMYVKHIIEDLISEIVEDVIENSQIRFGGSWNKTDVQYAIGQVLSNRLGLPQ